METRIRRGEPELTIGTTRCSLRHQFSTIGTTQLRDSRQRRRLDLGLDQRYIRTLRLHLHGWLLRPPLLLLLLDTLRSQRSLMIGLGKLILKPPLARSRPCKNQTDHNDNGDEQQQADH